jgi:hypothetical protein
MKKIKFIILIIFQIIIIGSLKSQPTNDTIIIIQYKYSIDNPNNRITIIDTIFPNALNSQNALIGTSAFYGSSQNRITGLKYGYYLVSVEGSESLCEVNLYEEENKIISITKNRYDLIADIKIVENCCNSFLGETEFKNDTTISLNYQAYGYNCSCSFCYSLKYTINGDFEDSKIKYFMINNDPKTLMEIGNN